MAKKAFVYDGSQWQDLASSVTDLSNYANLTTTPVSGFRNAIINGGMDIWQRGTSTTTTSAGYYTADRWASWIDSGSGTIAQDTVNIPTGIRYGLKYTSGGANGSCVFYHTIETANAIKLAGKSVTLSAYLTGTVGKNVQMSLWYSTTVDNAFTGSWTLVGASDFAATGTSTRIILANQLIPSTVKTIQVRFYNTTKLASTEFTSFTGVQLETGSIATPFEQRPIGTELALCQRYYYNESYGNYVGAGTVGYCSSTTIFTTQHKVPVTMRTSPVFSVLSGSPGMDDFGVARGLTYSAQWMQSQGGQVNWSASGLTAYRPSALIGNGNVLTVQFNAEL